MFWLMELDLLSLKGSAVSVVGSGVSTGSSMPLGSHSSFCGVRRASSFRSCFKWPSQHKCSVASSLLVPGIISGASVPCPACAAGKKLARYVLVWILSHCSDLCGLPQPPKLTLCVGACVHLTQFTEVHPLRRSLVCALVLAGCHILCHRACVHLFQLSELAVSRASVELFRLTGCPTLYLGFICTCSFLPALFVWSYLFFQLSQEGCVYCTAKSVCLLYWHPSPSFVPAVCGTSDTFGYLGLPFVLQGLCALVGFVCTVGLSAVSNSAGFICHATWRPGVFCS